MSMSSRSLFFLSYFLLSPSCPFVVSFNNPSSSTTRQGRRRTPKEGREVNSTGAYLRRGLLFPSPPLDLSPRTTGNLPQADDRTTGASRHTSFATGVNPPGEKTSDRSEEAFHSHPKRPCSLPQDSSTGSPQPVQPSVPLLPHTQTAPPPSLHSSSRPQTEEGQSGLPPPPSVSQSGSSFEFPFLPPVWNSSLLEEDWGLRRWESSEGWLQALLSIGSSRITRRVRIHLVGAASWAALVAAVYAQLPSLPAFSEKAEQFVASMIALLLAFRTEQAYQRFSQGRALWSRVASLSRRAHQLAAFRVGALKKGLPSSSSSPPVGVDASEPGGFSPSSVSSSSSSTLMKQKKKSDVCALRILRCVGAFPLALKHHLRGEAGGDGIRELCDQGGLSVAELRRVHRLNSRNVALAVASRLCELARDTATAEIEAEAEVDGGSTGAEKVTSTAWLRGADRDVRELERERRQLHALCIAQELEAISAGLVEAVSQGECIARSGEPPCYGKQTSRLLSLFLLTLPFTLMHPDGDGGASLSLEGYPLQVGGGQISLASLIAPALSAFVAFGFFATEELAQMMASPFQRIETGKELLPLSPLALSLVQEAREAEARRLVFSSSGLSAHHSACLSPGVSSVEGAAGSPLNQQQAAWVAEDEEIQ
uniref:Transmembrane protein n=1 Tax=Chromera velia CCMP2878 TaxID=1169474 RepID=A0A0G4I4L2_9ALVE|eukprot:Cvel_10917.t1-p1 / transcript=Cvel_10917.t1 / gene=Cvel_10917 / organism=Chromera_velia_CCMP2878 / gene_product=hypothetical protein / transcript_product=hypothetical protein / location=Cvel_scaffold670:66869-71139(-) / protein_length=651 / sequence_SO=supercontig / SO=protein_coding / is_pseudo=false